MAVWSESFNDDLIVCKKTHKATNSTNNLVFSCLLLFKNKELEQQRRRRYKVCSHRFKLYRGYSISLNLSNVGDFF